MTAALSTFFTQLVMMLLCVLAAPVDQEEFHISILTERGYMDTMRVQRQGNGYNIYDESNGKEVLFMSIMPKEGSEQVYVFTDHEQKSTSIDLKQIEHFSLEDLRSKQRLRLKTENGESIRIDRAKNICVLASKALEETFVVH